MLISYNDLTVNACAFPLHDAAAKASCLPQNTETPLREETVNGWTTRYTVSSKTGGAAGQKTARVRAYFADATLEADPGWVQAYAKRARVDRFGEHRHSHVEPRESHRDRRRDARAAPTVSERLWSRGLLWW